MSKFDLWFRWYIQVVHDEIYKNHLLILLTVCVPSYRKSIRRHSGLHLWQVGLRNCEISGLISDNNTTGTLDPLASRFLIWSCNVYIFSFRDGTTLSVENSMLWTLITLSWYHYWVNSLFTMCAVNLYLNCLPSGSLLRETEWNPTGDAKCNTHKIVLRFFISTFS